jgi:hypothetical protein
MAAVDNAETEASSFSLIARLTFRRRKSGFCRFGRTSSARHSTADGGHVDYMSTTSNLSNHGV